MPALADDARITRLLQAFDEAALWHDGKTLVRLRKWRGPIKLRIVGDPGDGYARFATETVETAAALAGIEVQRAADGDEPNFIIRFEETEGYQIDGRTSGCQAMVLGQFLGLIVHAELFISHAMRDQMRACIVRETMHAFGFPGHPHGLDSVLSYAHQRDHLTELDIAVLRILYDSRLGRPRDYLPALHGARRVIAEQIGAIEKGADASGFAGGFLEQAVGYLREAAEAGQILAQRQLGDALYFGDSIAPGLGKIIAQDETEALVWWRRAFAQGDLGAAFQLGEAARAGHGMAKDPAAAYGFHRAAADAGSSFSMLRVAQALETGNGVAVDLPAAAMFYVLAARIGTSDVVEARDAFFATRDATERARAEQAAKDWRPVR